MSVKPLKFVKLRHAHHQETAQDYVEMIQDLLKEEGEARVTEIAKRFGVSAVTTHKIILRLQKEKLVDSKPYRALFLTPKGKKMAIQSKKRHNVVYRFLKKLGVPEKTAQIDAEGIEHHVSPKTLRIFQKFMEQG